MKSIKQIFLCLIIMSVLIVAFAVTACAEVVSVTNTDGSIRIEYDTETNAMHVINVSSASIEFAPVTNSDPQDTTLQDFMNLYKTEVKSVKIDAFSRLNQYMPETFFYGFTALESVNIASGQRVRMRSTGMFEGCSSLTTLWLGDESKKTEGVIDLTGLANNSGDASTNNIFIANLFSGCTSVRKVILPEGSTYDTLMPSTFAGCSALEEVTIPANFLLIDPNAFADCTSLKAIHASEGSVAYGFAELCGLLPEEEYTSLWDKKDSTNKIAEGYLLDFNGSEAVETNIKWERHNTGVGTTSYTLYLYIDETVTTGDYADNTLITSHMRSSDDYEYGLKNATKKKHPFIGNSNANWQNMHTIVIGDGITGLKNGAFVGLSAVDTIEIPESLTSIDGGAFIAMNALSTVYVRGNAPESGKLDFGNVTYINFDIPYLFYQVDAAEYIFSNELETGAVAVANSVFADNTNLKSLDLSGTEITGLRYNTFANCTSLEEISLPASVEEIVTTSSHSFNNATALKAIYAPVGSYMHDYAMSQGYKTTHSADVFDGNGAHYATLVFDPETNGIEIISIDQSKDFYATHTGVAAFFDAYSELVTDVVVERFSKFRPDVSGTDSIFSGLTRLESVLFVESQRIYSKTSHLFAGCTALTTVYFGSADDMTVGVADLSNMNFRNISDRPAAFTNGLFSGCTSVRRVILPEFANSGSDNLPIIHANTFSGCTALSSVTLPSTLTGIADGAFEDCTALTELVMKAPVSLIGENTFAGATKGLVIYCASMDDVATVNGVLASAGIGTDTAFAFVNAGMKVGGYQIRTEDYNGLRTVFKFNENAAEGYNLVEYGSLSATHKNWNNYSESFNGEDSILSLSDNAIVTANDKIVKKVIYSNGSYVNNSNHKNKSSVSFNVTVIKFSSEAQYKAEIVTCGYEIWEKDGKYYAIYTNEGAYGYDSVSLYKTTLGMLTAGNVTLNKNDSDPIWNVLMDCEKTELTTDNSAVSAFLLADPLNTGKYIAIYATDSAESAEIKSLGIDASVKNTVSAKVFGKNVSYSLPAIDEYWQEHIDEKLAALPDGKSFIIFTDTHYEALSNGKNTRKVDDLISYVREQTGIKTVINMGDPYSKENTIEEAEARFREAVESNFYDAFGKDGLFVVGNHDANYTRWGKLVSGGAEEGVDGAGAYTVLLPDTTIYDATVKHIENKEGIVFDEDMIALADSITFKAIGIEGGEPYYDAEQVKKEFIAWAKQHYYYDDAENGIRYIVINSGNCGLIEYYILNKLYAKTIPTQIKFIANALSAVPTDENGNDYDVVLLGHMLASSEDYNDTYADIYRLLSAFKAGKSYTYTYNDGGNAAMNAVVGIDTLNVDFSGNDYNGTVFTMSGHWHSDLSYVYESINSNYTCNIPYTKASYISGDAVFYIGLNNDCIEAEDGMTMGTVNENCFSIVTITDNGDIILTRIGAGEDRIFSYN